MSYFPRTMIFVLAASTLMALIFLPTMGTLIGPRKVTKSTETLKALSGVEGDPRSIQGLTGVYVRIVSFLIRWPLLVILGTMMLCFMVFSSFGASMKGPPAKPVEFFTQEPTEQIFVLARARGNSTPQADLEMARMIEEKVSHLSDIGSIYTIAGEAAGGGGGNFAGPGNIPSDTVARVFIELVPFANRENTIFDNIDMVREAVKDTPGIYTEVVAIEQGPPVGKDLEIQLSASNPEELLQATLFVRERLEEIEGIFEVEDTLPLPGIEWELIVNREEAGRLGLDVSRIGAAIQFATEGALVAEYRPSDTDEEVDIRIRYPKGERDLTLLDSLRVLTPNGAVPLNSVVQRVPKPKQDNIRRRNQQLFYVVKANTQTGYATNVQVAEMKKWLDEEATLSSDVSYKFLGQEEENAAAARFGMAAGIAILFMMGVILLLQFNSFYHVFLTLSAVILSVFGVFLGLTFYPYVSVILTMTGVIALAGIVVNNNIVLIDTYQRLLRNGYEAEDAALRTAAQRLRPVLLTTVTTVVGLTPLILGWQADVFSGEFSTRGTSTSSIWAPISYVIATGLTFATLLTLVVTPVLLAAPTVWMKRLGFIKSDETDPPLLTEPDLEGQPAE